MTRQIGCAFALFGTAMIASLGPSGPALIVGTVLIYLGSGMWTREKSDD